MSSIVLASLSQARAKAADATIQSNLISVRSSAELQYSAMGCYTNTTSCTTVLATAGKCPVAGVGNIFGQTNIAEQIATAKLAGGSFASCYANTGGTVWAVAVVFRTTKTKAWCVDSTGTSKQTNTGSGFDYSQGELNSDVFNGVCGS